MLIRTILPLLWSSESVLWRRHGGQVCRSSCTSILHLSRRILCWGRRWCWRWSRLNLELSTRCLLWVGRRFVFFLDRIIWWDAKVANCWWNEHIRRTCRIYLWVLLIYLVAHLFTIPWPIHLIYLAFKPVRGRCLWYWFISLCGPSSCDRGCRFWVALGQEFKDTIWCLSSCPLKVIFLGIDRVSWCFIRSCSGGLSELGKLLCSNEKQRYQWDRSRSPSL